MLFANLTRRLHRLRSWRQHRRGFALPGELTLLEPDYQYGIGPLRLRLECVDWSGRMFYEGEYWYPVDGVQLDADGTELGRRQVLVRGSRLRG